MRRLIVNADDFGLTEKVNQAIVEGHERGILTSTSLLANGNAFHPAVERARSLPGLSVGAHLNLTEGMAVAKAGASSLVGSDGRFAFRPFALARGLATGRIGSADVECELRAQIEKNLAAGIRISHLDGHKHIHVLPAVFEAAVKLAKEYHIPCVRSPAERGSFLSFLWTRQAGHHYTILKQRLSAKALAMLAAGQKAKLARAGLHFPSHFFGVTQTGFLDAACLVEILERLPEGTSELMCHPGYADEDLRATPTRLLRQREAELQALTQPEIKHLVAARGIELIGYRELGLNPGQDSSGRSDADGRKLEQNAVQSA